MRRAQRKRICSVAQYCLRQIARLVFLTHIAVCAPGQQASLPPVNLGDTSFLDGIGNPGWLFEEIGQGVHDDKTLDNNGQPLPQSTDVNSATSLTHIAWLSGRQIMGAWYGAEVLLPLAYVDTGGHGVGCCVGDLIAGPILQWPEKHLFGRPYYQRVASDVYLPIGQYSRTSIVNIGNNAWAVDLTTRSRCTRQKNWRPVGVCIISGMVSIGNQPSVQGPGPYKPVKPFTSMQPCPTRYGRAFTWAQMGII